MPVEDFEVLFRHGKLGRLVQPTPENKPNSTVTIIEFVRVTSGISMHVVYAEFHLY
jgi:hypothetical protein